jgi:molecular chaperone GrpE (heat shock protein)
MNLVETLNAQLQAAAQDLEKANKELEAMIERHKKEREAAKASVKLLEKFLKDVESKIDKLQKP